MFKNNDQKRRIHGLLLRILAAGLLAFGVFLLIFGFGFAAASCTSEYPWWCAGGILGTIIGFVMAGTSLHMIREGRGFFSLSAPELIGKDTRAPVLILRPFDEDIELVDRNLPYGLNKAFGRSDEEILARVFAKIGPVIAIGDPKEQVPTLGAARLYLSDERWRAAAHELIERAQLVVITLGVSDGVSWELQEIARRVDPERVLLRLSPVYRGLTTQAIVDFAWKALPGSAPNIEPYAGRENCYICFDGHWTPQILTWEYSTFLYSKKESMVAGLSPFLQRFGVEKRRRRIRLLFLMIELPILVLLVGILLVGILSLIHAYFGEVWR